MVTNGQVVSFLYTLKDETGDVLDESGSEPLTYLQGAGNIVPGLERAMNGKKVGDRFDVVITPADGYGEMMDDSHLMISRSEFPEDMELDIGEPVMLEAEDGGPMPAWVVDMDDEDVTLDRNHPLAGVTLHFSIEVVEVRDATEEERSHGHVHGPGGEH